MSEGISLIPVWAFKWQHPERFPMENIPQRVEFRRKINDLQECMTGMIERGEMKTAEMRLKHYFCPTPDGRFLYARELWVAKDSTIIGKIHRFPCLNFVMQGCLVVATEQGQRSFSAPATVVSPAGTKRAGWILADTIWTTVHLTSYGSEAELDAIEDEIIAKTFKEIGLEAEKKEIA